MNEFGVECAKVSNVFYLGKRAAVQYGIPYSIKEPGTGWISKKRRSSNAIFFGHSSIYGTMMFYDPTNEVSMIFILNQAIAIYKSE